MTHAISLALIDFVWQGALVAVVARIMLWWLRNSPANLRYLFCCSALAVLTVLPMITTCVVYQRGGEVSKSVMIKPMRISPPAGQFVTPARTVSRPAWIARLQDWALPAWAAGVLLFSLRMIWGFTQVRSLRRRGFPAGSAVVVKIKLLSARMGLTRHAEALICSLSSSPSVIGWLKPVILLPASAISGLSAEQLEAVLAHELAHIRRHDYLVNILQMTVETLLFYHPAVWWVSGRIRHERELCCDDIAVSACQDAVCYARALSVLERLRQARPAMALGSTDGPLLYRIRRIVGDTGGDTAAGGNASRRSGGLAVALGLACIAISIGLLRGQASHADAGILVHAPGVVYQTSIEYPASEKAEGADGFVAIEVSLDAVGKVTEVRVKPPSTGSRNYHDAPPALQNAALAAVRQWRFAPGAKDSDRIVGIMFQADAHSAASMVQAGDFLFRSNRVDEAFRKYGEGALQHPENKIDFLKRQTEVLIRQGKTAEALQKDREILQEDPNDAEARGLLASFHLDQDADIDGVIKELWEVIDGVPSNFVAHFNLGRAYFKKGDVEQAEVQFQAALRLRPDYRPAKLALMQMAARKGDYAAVLRDADQLPEDLAAKILKASALMHLQRPEEARALVQEVLKKDPQNEAALRELAAFNELEKKKN